MILKVIGMFLLLLLQHRLMLIIFPQNMAKLSPFLLKMFVKAYKTDRFLAKIAQKNFREFPTKSFFFPAKLCLKIPLMKII